MIIIAENKEENILVAKLSKKHSARAVMREDGYAVTFWSIEDVKEKHTLSDDAAEAFLEAYENRLQESSISGGWDFIDYADISDYREDTIRLFSNDLIKRGLRGCLL